MAQEFSYHVAWDRKEHARAHGEVLRKGTPWLTWLMRGAIVMAGLTALAVLGSTDATPAAGLLAILPWIVIVALWVFLLRYSTGWIAARQVAKNDPDIVGGHTRVFREDGLYMSGATSSTRLSWDRIRRVVETDEFFHFFWTTNAAYYLPKRVIPTPQEEELFRAFVRGRIGERATLWIP